MPTNTGKTSDRTPGFFEDARRVVTPLRSALRELVADPAGPARPRADLPLNPTLRSRITRSIESEHLPSTLYYLPGPAGLRRVLDALKKAGADRETLDRCRRHINEYEAFLRRENVSRDGLHAMVGDASPEARAAMVRTNAQAVHKSMMNLIGYGAETMLASIIIMPGDSPGRCNMAQVRGFDALQHLRTDAWFMTSGYARTVGDAPSPRTLDGEPVDADTAAPLLEPYCSQPLPRFITRRAGRRQVYQLDEHEIGERSASTFYFGELIPDAYPDPPAETGPSSLDSPADGADENSPAQSPRRRAMISSIIATPARRLHFDVLVHRDVWRGVDVALDTYRIVPHGPVDEATVDERIIDHIDLGAAVQSFNAADSAFGASRIVGYDAMIADAMRRLNMRPGDFRVHRCETVYPLCDTQFALRFEK